MAVVFHLVCLVIGTAGIVHHHHESAVQTLAHHLLIERLRRVGLGFGHGLAVLVAESIFELLHGFAQDKGEHPVNLRQHLGLRLHEGIGRRAFLHHVAQLQRLFAELALDNGAHFGRILSRIGLRTNFRRYQPILLSKVGDAAESATVADGTLQEETYTQVVNGFLASVDDTLQEKIRLFQLVIEKEVILGERDLKGVLMPLGEIGTQHIQSAEHPATA